MWFEPVSTLDLIIKGLLIGVWSLVGESDFTSEAPVDGLIKEILAACKA